MWFICKFLQELEDQVTSDRNLNQMSLNKEFAFLGLHDQNSGKARRRYHGNSPPGTSRFHFLLGWVALSDQLHVGRTASTPLRLSMGEFRHERAWKEGTEASGWRSNQRRGPGRVLRAPSPGCTCSTPFLWTVGLFWVTCPGLASVWQTPAREGSRGMAWGSG